MLMKVKAVDFHHVPPEQQAIDAKLRNWSAWVKPRQVSQMASIWKLGKSNARQWHAPEIRETCDIIQAQAMEKAVYHLPEKHRDAIRWHYVYPVTPLKMCRHLGVSMEGLADLVSKGRLMLMNRGA